MPATTDPVDGTQTACRAAGPGTSADAPVETVVLVPGTAPSQAVRRGHGFLRAVRAGRRAIGDGRGTVSSVPDRARAPGRPVGPATRAVVLADVPAGREQGLAAEEGPRGSPAGAPGAKTVTWHP